MCNQTSASSFISTVTYNEQPVDCFFQAGVKNGMLMGEARRLCPDLVPIHYDFDAYREVSQALYDAVARWGQKCNIVPLTLSVVLLVCLVSSYVSGSFIQQFSLSV